MVKKPRLGHANRELFRTEIPKADVQRIDRESHYCHPIGDDRFKRQIEQRYGIKLGRLTGEGRSREKTMI